MHDNVDSTKEDMHLLGRLYMTTCEQHQGGHALTRATIHDNVDSTKEDIHLRATIHDNVDSTKEDMHLLGQLYMKTCGQHQGGHALTRATIHDNVDSTIKEDLHLLEQLNMTMWTAPRSTFTY